MWSGTSNCGDVEQFFVDAAPSSGSTSYLFRHGDIVRIAAVNNDLDRNCPATPTPTSGAGIVKTAHLSPRLGCRQLEIGLSLNWGPSPQSQDVGEKRWWLFEEKIGFTCGDLLDKTETPTLRVEVGTDDILRISGVAQPDGTTDWHLSVNYVTGDGYAEAKVYNTAWDTAIPQAEVERFGTDTGMSSTFSNLNLKKAGGTWVLWPDQTCETHSVDSGITTPWDYDRISATSFDIDHSGSTPCP